MYRNIESQNTFLGLAFPSEVLTVLASFWLSMTALAPGLALIATALTYAALRIVNYGRAPLFLQHWLLFRFRQIATGGYLSAAARSPTPRFPFAPYLYRDIAHPRL